MKQKLAINVFIAFILGMIASEVVTTILYNRTLIEFDHHDKTLSHQQSSRLHTQIRNQQKKKQQQQRRQDKADQNYNQLHHRVKQGAAHRVKQGAAHRSKLAKSNPKSSSTPSIFKSNKKNINLPQKNKGVQDIDLRISSLSKQDLGHMLTENSKKMNEIKKSKPNTYKTDLRYITLKKNHDRYMKQYKKNSIDHNAIIQNMKSMPRSYMR